MQYLSKLNYCTTVSILYTKTDTRKKKNSYPKTHLGVLFTKRINEFLIKLVGHFNIKKKNVA